MFENPRFEQSKLRNRTTNFKEKGQKQKFIWSQFNDCEKVEDKILISYWYKINPGLH